VDRLSGALKQIGSERARARLERAAGHRWRGLVAGTVVTTALDSSSVTIIILITLVDAGLLSFAHAIPVILGSNIGTTVSSQIFAANVDEYAPLLLLAGFLFQMLAKPGNMKAYGAIMFGIGLILFGLFTIGKAAEPLEGNQAIIDWLKTFATPLWGVVAGAAATVAIQSSSAMMGIVITLAGEGLIGLPAGIAIMLGAEIGTCADTLVATIGRSSSAVRAGVFHLLFNVITVTLGVLLIHQITAFAELSSSETGQQIANAHVAFNLAGALLFIPFTRTTAAILSRIVPGGGDTAPTTRTAEVPG
jgi:phosphate:Na+ symporter